MGKCKIRAKEQSNPFKYMELILSSFSFVDYWCDTKKCTKVIMHRFRMGLERITSIDVTIKPRGPRCFI